MNQISPQYLDKCIIAGFVTEMFVFLRDSFPNTRTRPQIFSIFFVSMKLSYKFVLYPTHPPLPCEHINVEPGQLANLCECLLYLQQLCSQSTLCTGSCLCFLYKYKYLKMSQSSVDGTLLCIVWHYGRIYIYVAGGHETSPQRRVPFCSSSQFSQKASPNQINRRSTVLHCTWYNVQLK